MRGATVSADPAALAALLPPGFQLDGEPCLTFMFCYMTQIEWLAGRGYNTLGVTVPVRYSGPGGPARGPLMLVLWENLCDPIITGREQLGIAKLYCALPSPDTDGAFVASWEGHEFLRLTHRVHEDVPPPSVAGDGTFHVRFLPGLSREAAPVISDVVLTPQAEAAVTIERYSQGTGSLAIYPTAWEQMPTQFHVVEGLRKAVTGHVISTFAIDARGAGDLSGQRRLGPIDLDLRGSVPRPVR